MKVNRTSQAMFMKCKCDSFSLMKGTLDAVYSCYLLKEKGTVLLRVSYPKILKGLIDNIGCCFVLTRFEFDMDIFYDIQEKLITDYFAKIRFHVYKTVPETFEHDLLIEIYSTESD